MSVDSYGPKGELVFDGTKKPDTAVDLTLLSEFAASVGNRKVGSRTDRLALSPNPGVANKTWEGLVFEQLDGADKGTWIYLGGEWVRDRIDFEYQQDGTMPPGFVAPPVMQAADELIVKAGMYRFITTPQAEIGSEWAPPKSFVTEFPRGLMAVIVSPIFADGLPAGVPYINSQNKSGFRVVYPGFVGIRQRAFNWYAVGY